MRLTLVISSLGCGGAERVMSIMANYWAKRGEEVTVLTFDHGGQSFYPLDPQVRRHALGLLADSSKLWQGLLRNLHRICVLRDAIRRSRPDIVISFIDKVNVLTLLAALGLRAPVVISERIDPSRYDIGGPWNFFRRLTYPKASALVCQSPAALASFDFLPSSMKHVIPNPVMPPFSSLNKTESHHPIGATYLIVGMGRLVEQKGFDMLLEAFKTISAKYPEWFLMILGEGPLRRKLERHIETLDLKSRVSLPGPVPDPSSVLRRADLFVLSSRFEGFPNALLEAMAAGLPVVSFDCPSGPRAIIRDGVDGLLVPPEDVGALASALDRLIAFPAERERLARHAPEVLERFGMSEIMAKWGDLIAQVRQ